jgi:hypothetical protein
MRKRTCSTNSRGWHQSIAIQKWTVPCANGSVLIEGTVGIILILTVLILCMVVIVNVILVINYKQRIGLVANSAIARGVRMRPGPFHTRITKAVKEQQRQEILKLVNTDLGNLGLPPCTAKKFDFDTDATGFETIHVSFQVDGLKLFAVTGLTPASISLSETASAILPCRMSTATYSLACRNVEGTIRALDNEATMVAYGRFKNGVSNVVQPKSGPLGTAAFRAFEHEPVKARFSFAPDDALFWGPEGISPSNFKQQYNKFFQ